MTLQPADLDRLEQLAREATPGPWTTDYGGQNWWIASCGMGEEDMTVWSPNAPSPDLGGERLDDGGAADRQNAAYIAALDPATIIELVAAARLGAAWQEAEGALPEGWVTGLIGIAAGPDRWYTASAYVDLTDYADDHDAESAQADSPAAALLALAEALRSRP